MKHQIYLKDKNVSDIIQSWSVTQSINMESSSAEMMLADNPGVNIADVVKIYVECQNIWIKLFEGVITEYNEELDGSTSISSLDYMYKLQWRMVISKLYSLRTSDYIIKDLLQTYYSNEFDTGKVSSYTVLGDLSLDYETAFDAIRKLAQFETSDFYVEQEGKRIVVKPSKNADLLDVYLIEGVNLFNLTKKVSDERLVNDFILRTGAIQVPVDKDAWTEYSKQRWGADPEPDPTNYPGIPEIRDNPADGAPVTTPKVGSQCIEVHALCSTTILNGGYFPKEKNLANGPGKITGNFNRLRFWWTTSRIGDSIIDRYFRICTDDNNYWQGKCSTVFSWVDEVISIGSGTPSVLQGQSLTWTTVGSPNWNNINYLWWGNGGDVGYGPDDRHRIDGLHFYYTSQSGVGSYESLNKTATDSDSQNKYGRRTVLKSAVFIQDPYFAQTYADAYLKLYKEPAVILEASTIFNPNLKAGYKIRVQSKRLGVEGEYRILNLTHTSDGVSHLTLTSIIPLSLQELLAEDRRDIYELMRRTQ